MTQVFHPQFGLFAKVALLVLLVMACTGIFAWRTITGDAHAVNEAVEQPVPFSHKHHVGDVGLDCRYCHTSVTTAAFAGIPPIATCMTCHSQLYTNEAALKPVIDSWRTGVALQWERVHQLPDFVYFDHSIHVAKGVGCETCHGRVDQMPLTRRVAPFSMKWCLACHREPAQFLRPPSAEYAMGWRAADQRKLGMALVEANRIDVRRLTDCSVCHR